MVIFVTSVRSFRPPAAGSFARDRQKTIRPFLFSFSFLYYYNTILPPFLQEKNCRPSLSLRINH